MKVALPTNEEIINGDVEFSNEEIIILKHPDLSTNLESTNENSLPAPASNEYTASRRAAIGDKVCGSKWLSGYKMYVYYWIYISVAIIFTFYYRFHLAAPLFVNMP